MGFLEKFVWILGFICVGFSWKNQSFEANDMRNFGNQVSNESAVDGNCYCSSVGQMLIIDFDLF